MEAIKQQSSSEQVKDKQLRVNEDNSKQAGDDVEHRSLGYGGWANLYVVND